MSLRRRTLVLLAPAALCMGVLLGGLAGSSSAGAQDPGVTTSSSTVITEAPVAVTEPAPASQTVVETAQPTETALFTESRKIMAIIAGLVCVAVGLAWLTYRFWRSTKPVRDVVPEAVPVIPPATPASVEGAQTGEVAIAEPPLADHHGADTDWESRTGEHVRIEPSGVAMVRPSDAARRAVLGVAAGPEVPIASDHG